MGFWKAKPMTNNLMRSPFAIRKTSIWKERLSKAYAFFAFTALGVVIFCCANGKVDWAEYYGLKTEEEARMRPGMQWANTLGIKKATVYKISGFTTVGKYEINEETTDDASQNTTAPK